MALTDLFDAVLPSLQFVKISVSARCNETKHNQIRNIIKRAMSGQ